MDAFELNKYSEAAYFKSMLSQSAIVSYGFISAIDFATVTVTLAVTDRKMAEKVTCVFLNLGNEQFSILLKPALNMRVLVMSPNKAAAGMYDDAEKIKKEQGKNFITTNSPAVFSSQYSICIPVVRSTAKFISSLLIDKSSLVAELKHDIITSLYKTIELDLYDDSNIELHEGTKHFRGCYGDMEQTFGMVQGTGGTEKPGTYIYKDTYGKFSSVEKNYESGMVANIGKAFEKPFLDDPGAPVDSSAPVTINLGTGAPVTLTFGESVMVVKADTEAGLDIALKGTLKVNITAEDGKFNFSNSAGSLKDILDMVADLCSQINTIGGPAAQALVPDLVTKFSTDLKTLIADVFE